MPSSRKAAAVLCLALVPLAACSKNSDTSTVSPPSASASAGGSGSTGSLAAEVPASVRSKGTLTVALDASYPPDEFIGPDGHTVVGWDADLAKAIGQQLGLTVKLVNAGFDSIIPGLASGKYDLGVSSFTDTKAREATVDFVTYFTAGTSFFGKTGGAGAGVSSLADLCGLTVAVEKGTTEADDAKGQSPKCVAAHKRPVNVQVYPDQTGANLALTSGRALVGMADSPVAGYQVKQLHGAFALYGKPYGVAPYGIAVPKGNGMAKAVLDAVKALMADGRYTQLLSVYGVQSGAITDPVINGATS